MRQRGEGMQGREAKQVTVAVLSLAAKRSHVRNLLAAVVAALGVLLVSAEHYKPPRFHMFYGFVSFITIGLLYSYRYVWRAKGWMELAYGLGGLFIMGLGIRAIIAVTAG